MADEELIKIEHLRRVDVQPGDRFVLTSHEPLSSETCARIQEIWKRFIGGDVPLLILPEGFEVGVLRQKAEC